MLSLRGHRSVRRVACPLWKMKRGGGRYACYILNGASPCVVLETRGHASSTSKRLSVSKIQTFCHCSARMEILRMKGRVVLEALASSSPTGYIEMSAVHARSFAKVAVQKKESLSASNSVSNLCRISSCRRSPAQQQQQPLCLRFAEAEDSRVLANTCTGLTVLADGRDDISFVRSFVIAVDRDFRNVCTPRESFVPELARTREQCITTRAVEARHNFRVVDVRRRSA